MWGNAKHAALQASGLRCLGDPGDIGGAILLGESNLERMGPAIANRNAGLTTRITDPSTVHVSACLSMRVFGHPSLLLAVFHWACPHLAIARERCRFAKRVALVGCSVSQTTNCPTADPRQRALYASWAMKRFVPSSDSSDGEDLKRTTAPMSATQQSLLPETQAAAPQCPLPQTHKPGQPGATSQRPQSLPCRSILGTAPHLARRPPWASR